MHPQLKFFTSLIENKLGKHFTSLNLWLLFFKENKNSSIASSQSVCFAGSITVSTITLKYETQVKNVA